MKIIYQYFAWREERKAKKLLSQIEKLEESLAGLHAKKKAMDDLYPTFSEVRGGFLEMLIETNSRIAMNDFKLQALRAKQIRV